MHKYTNTHSQKNKYTNTAYDKMTEIPNICYIFEQLVVQGCKNDNPKCSDPRYTVDFCTVPPGLFLKMFYSIQRMSSISRVGRQNFSYTFLNSPEQGKTLLL